MASVSCSLGLQRVRPGGIQLDGFNLRYSQTLLAQSYGSSAPYIRLLDRCRNIKLSLPVSFPHRARTSSPPIFGCPQRLLSCIAKPRVVTIEQLREWSAATFAKDEFADVRWVGVFGSFARGTQTDQSDVDIVIHRRKLKEKPQPVWFLEELLPQVWKRPVDIIYVRNIERDFAYGCYVTIESLLCSQTIYGSARDEEVVHLRRKAAQILDTGEDRFSDILKTIGTIRRFTEKTSQKEFLASIESQQTISSLMTSIFDVIDTMPREHPMYEPFHFPIFQKLEKIRQRISPTRKPNDEYVEFQEYEMDVLWRVTNDTGEGTMDNFAKRIRKFCFSLINETRQQHRLIRRLNPAEFCDY